jgi:hypothetical protein
MKFMNLVIIATALFLTGFAGGFTAGEAKNGHPHDPTLKEVSAAPPDTAVSSQQSADWSRQSSILHPPPPDLRPLTSILHLPPSELNPPFLSRQSAVSSPPSSTLRSPTSDKLPKLTKL